MLSSLIKSVLVLSISTDDDEFAFFIFQKIIEYLLLLRKRVAITRSFSLKHHTDFIFQNTILVWHMLGEEIFPQPPPRPRLLLSHDVESKNRFLYLIGAKKILSRIKILLLTNDVVSKIAVKISKTALKTNAPKWMVLTRRYVG